MKSKRPRSKTVTVIVIVLLVLIGVGTYYVAVLGNSANRPANVERESFLLSL